MKKFYPAGKCMFKVISKSTKLTHFKPMLYVPAENIEKPSTFCFYEVQKWYIGHEMSSCN